MHMSRNQCGRHMPLSYGPSRASKYRTLVAHETQYVNTRSETKHATGLRASIARTCFALSTPESTSQLTSIHRGFCLAGICHGLAKHGHKSELHIVFLQEFIFVLRANCHDRTEEDCNNKQRNLESDCRSVVLWQNQALPSR